MIKTKYRATVQKGQGDKFFEWEVVVEAWNIGEAATMVHNQVKDFDGWTVAIVQGNGSKRPRR